MSTKVRIFPDPPVLFRASVTEAQRTPNPLDGVQFPGSEPIFKKVQRCLNVNFVAKNTTQVIRCLITSIDAKKIQQQR